MKIRSITYFCNPKFPLDEKMLRTAGEFLATAKAAYEAAGYEVQTRRLATTPFPMLLPGDNDFSRTSNLPRLAQQLEMLIQQADIAYASLGPALPEQPQSYAAIPDAIAQPRSRHVVPRPRQSCACGHRSGAGRCVHPGCG